ncbi:hypothetical protein CEXT_356901 [Caerostris extrusa]|uniref:Uncharacterized protein n=1 Tax=Caerostris extrusa TaxID=172846 RepID=A0AAV4QW07_CAEEX|nr:hypothetical protein CEXT_356901 [Caerostris extrusa]
MGKDLFPVMNCDHYHIKKSNNHVKPLAEDQLGSKKYNQKINLVLTSMLRFSTFSHVTHDAGAPREYEFLLVVAFFPTVGIAKIRPINCPYETPEKKKFKRIEEI